MMRSTPVYAPDGMTSSVRQPDFFDDGLVHNHHWAVSTDEAYPSLSQGPALERRHGLVAAGAKASHFQSQHHTTHADDRHDDGLVHNHGWAVSGK